MSSLKSRVVKLEAGAQGQQFFAWLEGERGEDGRIVTATFCWADQNPEFDDSEPAVIPNRRRIL